jgi:hypothetical protein
VTDDQALDQALGAIISADLSILRTRLRRDREAIQKVRDEMVAQLKLVKWGAENVTSMDMAASVWIVTLDAILKEGT